MLVFWFTGFSEMFIVLMKDSNEAYSYGTVLADPMPEQFTVRLLTDDEAVGVSEGRLMWDAATSAFVQNPHWVPSGV